MEPAETQSLRLEIERRLRGAFDEADVLPRLARLARLAPAASDDGIFANQKLAELLVERDPWRAALFVRRALAHRDDDRAWAILAFCHTLLGNFRSALGAYKRALACDPDNPWYAHNLGHLLDVALGEPGRALVWLKSAFVAKGDNTEIVASYVHALARSGETVRARDILERALERGGSRELDALLRWLDEGAPQLGAARGRDKPPARGRRKHASDDLSFPATKSTRAAGAPLSRDTRRLVSALERGLSRLPLDSRQRERALALAHDALPARPAPAARASEVRPQTGEHIVAVSSSSVGTRKRRRAGEGDVASLAAAVAYAIVYIDHVPLSQAEVAAPFRVGVGHLRGRFAELRARLDIIRGDARYATTRR